MEILGHAGLAARHIDAQRDRDEHGQPDIYVVPDRDRYPTETPSATPLKRRPLRKRPLCTLWAATDCDGVNQSES